MSGFNEGLDAFAQSVAEMGLQAARQDPAMAFPYRIDSGRIGGLSLSYAESVEWTRAMKYLLTDLKWVVAWRAKAARTKMVIT